MDKNRKENGKFNEKEWYRKNIIEKVSRIEDAWILHQVYRCIENLLK